ncbi:MAG: hypothetical protein H7831_03795 [Magnetococcus sp. WYHC-3]
MKTPVPAGMLEAYLRMRRLEVEGGPTPGGALPRNRTWQASPTHERAAATESGSDFHTILMNAVARSGSQG